MVATFAGAERLAEEVKQNGSVKLPATLVDRFGVSEQSARRWYTPGYGVKMPDGRRLVLEALRLSERVWVTSEAAIVRFLAAQQPEPAEGAVTGPRSPNERTKASTDAERELVELGL